MARLLDSGAEVGRWVELDETAAVLIPRLPRTAMSSLGVVDGLITAYDGLEQAQEGLREGDRLDVTGGFVRVGLGLGGMTPGLPGAIFEGLCGLYSVGEGHVRDNDVTKVAGLTQLGVSFGMGALALGLRGPLGPALVLGSGAARLGYFLHDLHQRRQESR